MFEPGSLLDLEWLRSNEGSQILNCLLHRNGTRLKQYGKFRCVLTKCVFAMIYVINITIMVDWVLTISINNAVICRQLAQ